MSEAASAFDNEVLELRETVRDLTRKVERLTDRVLALERERSGAGSYSFVNSESRARSPEPASSEAPVLYQNIVRPQVPETFTSPGEQSWSERESIAAEVGRFLKRALSGEFRGRSGRDKIRYNSNFYIVVRDANQVVTTHPVRIFTRYTEVKSLCQREKKQFGDCIFVGLPTLREVDCCLSAAGFSRSPNIH